MRSPPKGTKTPKPRRASLPKGETVEGITLETALRLLSLPREIGLHPDDMLQLRDGTTPVNAPHGIDLAVIVERIRRAKSAQKAGIEVQCDERVQAIGHEDRLERVIGHVVQNAIDATSSEGRVWIRLGRQDGHALVEVGDTGHGMTPEFVRERLFKPFQTTKQGGMGIGAYESYQYVQELGGQVKVDSTPGVGTRVQLLLPVFGMHAVATPDAKTGQPLKVAA